MGHNAKSDENKANRKGTMQACLECGTEFYVPPSQQGKRQMCSKECKATRERKDVLCVCGYCGADFNAKERDVRRGRGQFCSVVCSGAAKTAKAKAEPRKKIRTQEDWDKYNREASAILQGPTRRRKRRANH